MGLAAESKTLRISSRRDLGSSLLRKWGKLSVNTNPIFTSAKGVSLVEALVALGILAGVSLAGVTAYQMLISRANVMTTGSSCKLAAGAILDRIKGLGQGRAVQYWTDPNSVELLTGSNASSLVSTNHLNVPTPLAQGVDAETRWAAPLRPYLAQSHPTALGVPGGVATLPQLRYPPARKWVVSSAGLQDGYMNTLLAIYNSNSGVCSSTDGFVFNGSGSTSGAPLDLLPSGTASEFGEDLGRVETRIRIQPVDLNTGAIIPGCPTGLRIEPRANSSEDSVRDDFIEPLTPVGGYSPRNIGLQVNVFLRYSVTADPGTTPDGVCEENGLFTYVQDDKVPTAPFVELVSNNTADASYPTPTYSQACAAPPPAPSAPSVTFRIRFNPATMEKGVQLFCRDESFFYRSETMAACFIPGAPGQMVGGYQPIPAFGYGPDNAADPALNAAGEIAIMGGSQRLRFYPRPAADPTGRFLPGALSLSAPAGLGAASRLDHSFGRPNQDLDQTRFNLTTNAYDNFYFGPGTTSSPGSPWVPCEQLRLCGATGDDANGCTAANNFCQRQIANPGCGNAGCPAIATWQPGISPGNRMTANQLQLSFNNLPHGCAMRFSVATVDTANNLTVADLSDQDPTSTGSMTPPLDRVANVLMGSPGSVDSSLSFNPDRARVDAFGNLRFGVYYYARSHPRTVDAMDAEQEFRRWTVNWPLCGTGSEANRYFCPATAAGEWLINGLIPTNRGYYRCGAECP